MFSKRPNTLLVAFAVVACAAIMLPACYPSSPDYIDDYDLVYTKQDTSFDFSKVRTYKMPDSVAHIVIDPTKADRRYDDRILKDLTLQLNALGWQQLPDNGNADVVVLPSVSSQVNGVCNLYCWWCYWGWWPGWGPYTPAWDQSWGWYYPTGLVCAAYNTGTLVVNITNPNGASQKKLPIAWMGVANGLLEGSISSITSRIDKSIAQMFIQSPYLKK